MLCNKQILISFKHSRFAIPIVCLEQHVEINFKFIRNFKTM